MTKEANVKNYLKEKVYKLNKNMGVRKNHIIENNIEKKHCPTCNEWKELIEFNKQSSSWDNLAGMCRKCFTEYRENMRKNKNVLEKLKHIVNLRNDEEWNVLGKIR